MKIFSLKDMEKIAHIFKYKNAKITQAHGCFDLLHVGHTRHFQEASTFGEVLVVTVTDDKFVNKGDDRPIFPIEQRMEMIAALECVDFVVANEADTAVDAILAVKPDIYVKGIDYADKKDDVEYEAVKRIGGVVKYTKSEKFSTTDIIRRIRHEH